MNLFERSDLFQTKTFLHLHQPAVATHTRNSQYGHRGLNISRSDCSWEGLLHEDRVLCEVELVNTVPFKDSSHYESLTKLNQVVRVT